MNIKSNHYNKKELILLYNNEDSRVMKNNKDCQSTLILNNNTPNNISNINNKNEDNTINLNNKEDISISKCKIYN